MRIWQAFVLAGLLLLQPGVGSALTLPATSPSLRISVSDGEGNRQSLAPRGAETSGGDFSYSGGFQVSGEWDVSFELLADPDPFVQGVFAVTNQSSQVKQMHLEVSLPIFPPIPGGTLIGGSVGGALTDANFDGSAALDAPSLFVGYNDGVAALGIGGVLASAVFAGQTVGIPAQNVGLPGPSLPGPQALSEIAISLDFSLTPGDQASFNAFYVVSAVPEPGAMSLFATGLAVLAWKGRRSTGV